MRAVGPVLTAGALLLAVSCARPGAPPGGPPDERPPVVVSVTPDTFAVVETGRGEIRIVFDERISERTAAGPLDAAVRVSPRTGRSRVQHRRDGLSVELDGGFRPGLVYRVRVEPVVQDMFGNTMRAPFEWVFSTGADFQKNAVGGLVWDRLTGEPLEEIQVVLRPGDPADEGFDTLPAHVAFTDTAGIFALRYLPAGTYHVTAFQDRNLNDRPDPIEVQGRLGQLEVGAADTVVAALFAMVPDTTPPQVVRAEVLDSLTIVVRTDDPLDPSVDVSGVVAGVFPEDGSPPALARVLHPHEWRAYQDTLRARADSAAALARADSAAALPDSLVADTTLADTAAVVPDPGEPLQAAPRAAGPPAGGARPEPEEARLPNGERVPEREFFIRLAEPLQADAPYTLRVRGLTNISGLVSEEQETAVSYTPPAAPDEPPPDSLALPDSLAPPDTGAVADTGGVAGGARRLRLRPSP